MYFASSRLIAWKLGTHTFCNISPDIFVIFDHEVKIKNANGNFWKSKKFQKHKQFSKYEKITKMKNNPQKQKIQKYIKYKQIGQNTKKYHDLKLWSGPGSKSTYLKSVEVFWNGGCVYWPGRPLWPGYYGQGQKLGGCPKPTSLRLPLGTPNQLYSSRNIYVCRFSLEPISSKTLVIWAVGC